MKDDALKESQEMTNHTGTVELLYRAISVLSPRNDRWEPDTLVEENEQTDFIAVRGDDFVRVCLHIRREDCHVSLHIGEMTTMDVHNGETVEVELPPGLTKRELLDSPALSLLADMVEGDSDAFGSFGLEEALNPSAGIDIQRAEYWFSDLDFLQGVEATPDAIEAAFRQEFADFAEPGTVVVGLDELVQKTLEEMEEEEGE